MRFESELKKGKFTVTECNNCKKTIWPPSDFCNICFNQTILRHCNLNGKILEYSKHQGKYFCLVVFEKTVIVFAEIISGIPEVGRVVTLEECGIKNGNYFFKISIKN